MWDLFISVQSHSHTLYLSKESLWFCRHFCPLSRSSLNLFDFCPGGHIELLFLSRGSQWVTISVQGITMSYYFCPGGHNELLFLSRGSQWVTIFVQGVTMSYYFCPGGHKDLLFLSRGSFCFFFVWWSLWIIMHVQGESSILSSVLVERSSK